MEAIWCIRRETKLSTTQIGLLFDGRDHSTIMYSLRKVREWLETGEPWPIKNENINPNIDFLPGNFRIRFMSKAAQVVIVPSQIDEPVTVRRVRALKPTGENATAPVEKIVTLPCKALRHARNINNYWSQRGVNANARAVKVGNRIIVKSDLTLVG